MTALSASISMNARPDSRGDFAAAVGHPIPAKTSGAISTFFQTLFSFGLLPLLLWPTRWSEFLDSERQDFLDLIAWWRWRVMPDDAAQLDKIARGFRPRPILMVLPLACGGI